MENTDSCVLEALGQALEQVPLGDWDLQPGADPGTGFVKYKLHAQRITSALSLSVPLCPLVTVSQQTLLGQVHVKPLAVIMPASYHFRALSLNEQEMALS